MPEMQKRAAPTTCCAPVHKKCRQHSSVLEFESGAGEEKSDSFDSHDEHSKIAVSISNYQWKDSPPVPRRTSSRACTIKIKPLDLSCSPDSPTVLNARCFSFHYFHNKQDAILVRIQISIYQKNC